jgi:hypothetical protein
MKSGGCEFVMANRPADRWFAKFVRLFAVFAAGCQTVAKSFF